MFTDLTYKILFIYQTLKIPASVIRNPNTNTWNCSFWLYSVRVPCNSKQSLFISMALSSVYVTEAHCLLCWGINWPFTTYINFCLHGISVNQAVSFRPLTTEARFQTQTSVRDSSKTTWPWDRIPCTSVLPYQYHITSPQLCIHHHLNTTLIRTTSCQSLETSKQSNAPESSGKRVPSYCSSFSSQQVCYRLYKKCILEKLILHQLSERLTLSLTALPPYVAVNSKNVLRSSLSTVPTLIIFRKKIDFFLHRYG
jgi:hypothetical protein